MEAGILKFLFIFHFIFLGDILMLRDSVGNQLSNARLISLTTKIQTFRDGIGGSDTEDFYRFTIGSARDFSLNLNGLIANADVQLLNQSGSVIASSTQNGTTPETIARFLTAGTYYIRVFSNEPNQTVYNLNLSAAPDAGSNFQTAIAITPGTPITGYLDPSQGDIADYYRFRVTQISALISPTPGNPQFLVLDSLGNPVAIPLVGPSGPDGVASLVPGQDYYVAVSSFTGSYSFTVSTLFDVNFRRITPPGQPLVLTSPSTVNLEFSFFSRFNLFAEAYITTSSGQIISPTFNGTRDEFGVGTLQTYALNAGTYYVRTTGYMGEYSLGVDVTPDSGNTLASALVINPNQSQVVNGNFLTFKDVLNNSTDPNDYYRFSLNQATDFQLNLLNSLDDPYDLQFISRSDVSVQLLNSAGVIIASSNSALDYFNTTFETETISRFLDAGTYYIRVSLGSGNSAAYTLDISGANVENTADTGGNTQAKARFLNANSSVTDRISPLFDPNDYYSFFVNGRNHVRLNFLDGVNNLGVQLLNQSGQVIASSSTAGSTDIINRFLNTGTYYVRVFSPTGDSGEYQLNIATIADVGNTLGSARSIQPTSNGIVQNNRIEDADPTDYYRFFLSQSGVLDLRLLGLSADLNVQLLDGAGRVIVAGNNPGTNPEAFNRLLSRGTYYIQVLQGSSGANSDYDLALNLYAIEGNSFATATRLALTPATAFLPTGFTTRRWIDSTQPQDFYKFTIATDTNFKLALTPSTSNVDLQLYTNTGALIGSSSNSGLLADEIITALAAGTYYLRVVQPVPGAGSSYSLSGTALV
jgi:trimeric autotransporter adhesin